MTIMRISRAAAILGVSDDTVRRWVDGGRLPAGKDASGRAVVDGADLVRLLAEQSRQPDDPVSVARGSSARNRFVGLVTAVHSDTVMSQVELQCGPHRVVSLMSTEAVHDLDLRVGSIATASVKATTVIVETPPDGEDCS